jgi:CopA family copper-resistance protein
VIPLEDRAYTLFGEAADRSGMARATLAPRPGMAAEVPPLRKRPLATMRDMGMDMSSMAGMEGMEGMDVSGGAGAVRGIDPTAEQNPSARLAIPRAATIPAPQGLMAGTKPLDKVGMDRSETGRAAVETVETMDMMSMKMRDFSNAPQVLKGPGVQMIAPMPVDRTGEPGQGLVDVGHRVLVYKDLMALTRNPDTRAPGRSLDIHLTGNMERFMWSFDGVKMSDHMAPIPFVEGERVRINLINDSMMAHPIHIHGHFFELVTGHGEHGPRKHTVIVQPGGIVTWDFTADAVGDWAFHCHLLYHMYAGMMRTVSVRPRGDAA